jgi:hypothetical protein
MATTVASLRILLGLDSKDVRDGAGSVKSELKGIQAEAKKTQGSFSEMKAGLGAGIGIGAGFSAFTIAADVAAKAAAPIGAPWTCEHCGEALEPQFTSCWRCGAVSDKH